jgi:RNA recognition motif-containing protein
MNIFVGNLSFKATENDLKSVFAGFGDVTSAIIVKEKAGVKSRGFGFVQLPDERQALAAIAALDGKEFMSRRLNVSPADTKPQGSREAQTRKKAKPGFPGYKQGRRSRSFMKQRAASGRRST